MSGKASDEARGHRPATIGIHAGLPEPVLGGPVVLPVVQSATFFGGAGEPASELLYSRYGNNPKSGARRREDGCSRGHRGIPPPFEWQCRQLL